MHCQGLIQRFINWNLIRDPNDTNSVDKRNRIDIGTSLGNRGADQEGFYANAVYTHKLFEHLFDDFRQPGADNVRQPKRRWVVGKEVKTAQEPEGRRYGPAIFRTHYTSHRYPPHIDSVRCAKKRTNYAVYRFEHQFAGILLFSKTPRMARTIPKSFCNNCLWTPGNPTLYCDGHL